MRQIDSEIDIARYTAKKANLLVYSLMNRSKKLRVVDVDDLTDLEGSIDTTVKLKQSCSNVPSHIVLNIAN